VSVDATLGKGGLFWQKETSNPPNCREQTVSTDCAPDSFSEQAPFPPLCRKRRNRREVVRTVVDFEESSLRDDSSQRAFADKQLVPRSTLQGWLKRKQGLQAAPELRAFLETPVGLEFLHGLVQATQLLFHQAHHVGLRPLCEFFHLVGLAPFLATSYGAQQQLALQREQQIVAYGKQERLRLGAQMARKKICLVEDENFHERRCLVGAEPVSNFLLVERFAEQRDAPTWTQAVQEGTLGLNVEVVGVTSDQAAGILHHAEQELGAHRSPDLFPGQHDLSKGTSAALSAKERAAQTASDQALQQWQQEVEKKEAYEAHPGPGRPPHFEAHLALAAQAVEQTQQALRCATANKEAMHQVVLDLGAVYHPYDLQTGVDLTPAELKTALGALRHKAQQTLKRAQLGDKAKRHLDKAARLFPLFVATLAFYFTLAQYGFWGSATEEP
jgi:hypothetical protein